MFSTNLEPANARCLLPCLDEPLFKANFQLKVKIRQDRHVAISGPPIKIIRDSDNFVTFEETPKMSSYLLVCIVGLFERVEVG